MVGTAYLRTGLRAFQRRQNIPGRLHQARWGGSVYSRLGEHTFEAIVDLSHLMRCSIKWTEHLAKRRV